jgi:hypothetical protein
MSSKVLPSEDPTSLGAILLAMGALVKEDLQRAVSIQREASSEELLGHILVSRGFCDPDQIRIALHAQSGMRKSTKKDQALAVADLAERLRTRTIAESHRIVERGNRFVRSATGREYPIITDDMLISKPEK